MVDPADKDARETILSEMRQPRSDRLWYVADAFRLGMTQDEVFEATKIDRWFLVQIEDLVLEEQRVQKQGLEALDYARLRALKRKGFGDRLLIDGLSLQLPPGGIVGVIGANGAGKTTFFRMITGEEQPDAGSLRLGDTVRVAAVDQSRDALDDSKTVWEEISDGLDMITVGNYETSSRAYVGRFNFRGQDQQKKIGLLSGGERNRVHLARTLKAGGNLLLLDEPTNDLDVETLRALEEALLEFPGSAIVISHDRWFLDRIATHILAFEGNSEVVWFAGNYADYEEDRKRRLGADAANPHRIKYKRLDA